MKKYENFCVVLIASKRKGLYERIDRIKPDRTPVNLI